MAYRTSKPLHPTEFGDPEVLSRSSKHKSRPKKRGYKTASLLTSVTKNPIDNDPKSKYRATTSVVKKKGRSGKKMKSKGKHVAASSTKLNQDDPNTKITYTTNKTKTKKGHTKTTKLKSISKEKYLRKRARLEKSYRKFKGN